jgi:glycerophosphoryl diester phosphodiesterase
MGANGIETDVQRTRDGVLVLFHDKTMERAVGLPLDVGEYTYDEIKDLRICRGELWDRITTLERFLEDFGKREDLTLAIELKADGIEREVADLIRMRGKVVAVQIVDTDQPLPLEYEEPEDEQTPGLALAD